MMGVLHSQQQQKKKIIEMLNLLVNIRKEFIRINSESFILRWWLC